MVAASGPATPCWTPSPEPGPGHCPCGLPTMQSAAEWEAFTLGVQDGEFDLT